MSLFYFTFLEILFRASSAYVYIYIYVCVCLQYLLRPALPQKKAIIVLHEGDGINQEETYAEQESNWPVDFVEVLGVYVWCTSLVAARRAFMLLQCRQSHDSFISSRIQPKHQETNAKYIYIYIYMFHVETAKKVG